MEIAYARSSSLGTLEYCEHKYFLIYNLGLQETPNIKTVKGTIVHKVLEMLAVAKKYHQDNPSEQFFTLKDCDKEYIVDFNKFLTKRELSDKEVDDVNKSRINKSIYVDKPFIEYGHTRLGEEIVSDIIDIAYNYYSSRYPDYEWGRVDKRDCENFTWMALDTNDGMYDPRKARIVQPENSFVIPIDLPWAYYFDENGEAKQFAIKGTIDLITQVDDNTYEVVDWKGLPLNTPLATPTGWTTMGDVDVGDYVIDMDGNPTKVIGKSQVKKLPCYQIEFDDTSKVECDNEHLWVLTNNEVKKVTELKVNDYIPTTQPLQLPEQDLPIDPYLLGYWLGNGRNRGGEICTPDNFVLEEISRRGYKIGKNIGGKNKCGSYTVYGLTTKLKSLNLINNKHIPNIYLRASLQQRIDLLRGLMDSDGNINTARKQAIFTNCTLLLSENVKELLLSLGQRPLISNVKCKGFGLVVECFPVSFRPIGINPFLLPRKSDLVLESWGNGNSDKRRITRIIDCPLQETQCIMVDSPTNTYLCTNNMIPTHNTGGRKNWATNTEKSFDILCKDKQLMLYYYAARKLFPDKQIIFTIFFIRDGGPFSLCFDDIDLLKVEAFLEKHFLSVRENTLPKMRDPFQKDFQCKTLCHFYKNKQPGTNLNICKYMHNELRFNPMSEVIQKYKDPNFVIDRYQNPGE